MQKGCLKILVLFYFLTIVCNCGSFSSFFSSINLSGSWYQTQVMQPLGPCKQCIYSIDIQGDQLNFRIYNSLKPNNDFNFQLNKIASSEQEQHSEQIFIFSQRVLNYKLNAEALKINIKIQVNTQIGTIYNYTIVIENLALYIQDSNVQNSYLVVAQLLIYTIFLAFLFPTQRYFLQKSIKQTHQRICLFTLCFYTQLSITMTAISGLTALNYMYYSPTILTKLLCYCLLGPCTLMGLLHNIYCLAAIQKKLNQYLTKNTIFKLLILGLGMLVGLILFPLLLTLFNKGIWFFYFYSLGIIVQFIMSSINSLLPYNRFMFAYFVNLIFVMIQTDKYPILNFQQLNYFSITFFIIFMLVIFILGFWHMKKIGNLENTAQMFDLNSQKRQGRKQNKIDNTQSYETDISNQMGNQIMKGSYKIQQIKSDLELN